MILTMTLVMIVVMIESTGMFLALGDMTGKKIDQQMLTAGLRTDGLGTLIGGIFNTFPYTSFSQNVGLVGVTGVQEPLRLRGRRRDPDRAGPAAQDGRAGRVAADLRAAEQALRDAALEYHRNPTPRQDLGHAHQAAVQPARPVAGLLARRGLPLPGHRGRPDQGAEYTSRGNLVGVITNGTAVLGLGDIGPLAGKPVMEGKGCLFKKFAGIDVFDIELAERDPDKLVEIIAALEPTLGGINLEDIKAPECFYIERKLRERMNIPVFHDDQHGTAIISSAALLNGLELVGKQIGEVKVAVSGAGAAAIACLDVMVGLGVKRENIFVCDSKGVIYEGRPGKLDESKGALRAEDRRAHAGRCRSTAPTCSWAARPPAC
jgi:hypothetical protein